MTACPIGVLINNNQVQKWGEGGGKPIGWPTHFTKWVGNCPPGPPGSYAYGQGACTSVAACDDAKLIFLSPRLAEIQNFDVLNKLKGGRGPHVTGR